MSAHSDEHPPASEVRLTEGVALRDLHAVLRLCDSGRLRCSDKTKRPAAAALIMVAEALTGGDFYRDEAIAAYAWPLIVQAGGLATVSGGKLQLTARGRAALSHPAAEVIRQLWRSWVAKGAIDELSRVEHLKGQRAANVLTAVKTRREIVATALANREPGAWVEVEKLFASMRRSGLSPTVARNGRAVWKLYLVDAQYGSCGYDGYGTWQMLEGRYTLAVVFEYAATLGLIDVAYDEPEGARDDFRYNASAEELPYLSRYDGLRALRLNGLGAYVLGLTDTYLPPTELEPVRALKVLPSLDVVATGEIDTADQLTLDAYARWTADRVWTLTSETVVAAIAAGRDVGQFRAFLESRMMQPQLPSTLVTLLADVTARTQRVRDLGRVRLIECADPALAALIHHDRRLSPLCALIGDRHLEVTADDEPAFLKALQTLGYALPV
ncbi:MAG: helicase-associated domain-containing protein [Humibacillus sp.]|nr:helicase-associated domain-containing protein [Humibacillus sp.]MDN5775679.1 helicase-associated domain-containing protein [Humibacillus sp.]